MTSILLVCAEPEWSREIRKVLSEKLETTNGAPLITPIDNMKEAKDHLLTNRFDLVITDLHIPADSSSLIDSVENGIELLGWMRDFAKDSNTPAELIIPRLGREDSERIDKTSRKIPNCHVAPMGPKFMGKLVNLSKECLQEISGTSQRGYLEVQIDLANKLWKVTGKDGMSCSRWGRLTVDEAALSDVGKLSSQIGQNSESWQRKLEEIGIKLKELLLQPAFDNHSKLYTELSSCIKEELARGNECSLEDTRVRFIVNPKFHSVLLESVMFPEDPKFWMLQAPISRQLMVEGMGQHPKPPLFDRRFNCLLIDANLDQTLIKMADSPTGKPITLESLKHSSQECKDLKKLFSNHKNSVDRVELIRRKSNEENFYDTVKDFLENKGPWDLVHFGGHSLVDQSTNEGYVFLQGVGKIISVEIAMFAQWLRQTSFIFLSSCESSAKDFVLQLVHNQVPAVAGFRWDVEDEIAVQYADVFYNELFSEKSLDRAFFKARCALYERHKYNKNRIWAAPMLVDQHDL